MAFTVVLSRSKEFWVKRLEPVAPTARVATMRQWILYVDESGLFEERKPPFSPNFVGGVLVDITDVQVDLSVLKRGLLECFPFLSWPLHATVCRQPAAHVAGSMFNPGDGPPWIKRLHEAVERRSTAALKGLHLAVERREVPDQAMLLDATRDLVAEAPALITRLRELMILGERKLSTRLAHVARLLGDSLLVSGAAAESAASYPVVLTAAIRSSLRLIRRRLGPQPRFRLTVAARGKSNGEDFNDDDVMACASEAMLTAFPFSQPRSPDIEIVSDLPKPMNESTSPWLVVADFACNRLFSQLGRDQGFADLERYASSRLGLPLRGRPEWSSRPLPSLDFEGEGARAWVSEQRLEWEHARRVL